MRLEQALYNHLSTFAGLMAVIGDRLYPLRLPQGCAYPAAFYTRVSRPIIRTFSGNQGARPRVQVTCVGKSYEDAKAVADQVVAALDRYSGTMGGPGGLEVTNIFLDNELDGDFDTGPQLYHVVLDFIVWHA